MPEEKKKTERVPMMRYIPRTPLPRHYCLARVRNLYKRLFNYSIIDITGYKGSRYTLYKRYKVIDNETQTVIEDSVTLYDLGVYLDRRGWYDNPPEDEVKD